MSYCRFSSESDVYVYESGAGLECCTCALVEEIDCPAFRSRREMLAHLAAHRAAGHAVPQEAVDEIERELAELGDEVLLR